MIAYTVEITDNERGGNLLVRIHEDSATKSEQLIAANLKKVLQAWIRVQNDAHQGIIVTGAEIEAEADRLIAAIQQKRDEIRGN